MFDAYFVDIATKKDALAKAQLLILNYDTPLEEVAVIRKGITCVWKIWKK